VNKLIICGLPFICARQRYDSHTHTRARARSLTLATCLSESISRGSTSVVVKLPGCSPSERRRSAITHVHTHIMHIVTHNHTSHTHLAV
jgi:hypothetical protein